ncbi:MAG: carbohydrate kinase [Bacteroidota bacterium]|jgi:fructokinase
MEKVVSFGEILFDVYPDKELPGGAPFNFICHVRQLTGQGAFLSRIGIDDRGDSIVRMLAGKKVGTTFVQRDPAHPTGAAFVRLDEMGIPSFTIAEEAAYDFIEAEPGALSLVSSCSMLYYGTLAQRSPVSRRSLAGFCDAAPRCFCDVNLRQNFYTEDILRQSLEQADFLKLNEEELNIIASLFFPDAFTREEKVRRLMDIFSISFAAVTMGSDGSEMYSSGIKDICRTTVQHIADTVGAGDGFAAMMCAGILAGWELKKIHRAASEFSAALCCIEGALPEEEQFYSKFSSLF